MKPVMTEHKILKLKSKVYPVQLDIVKVPVAVDAQRQFIPTWGKRIAAALDLDKIGTPVVNHRDGVYWQIDGQHRVWALKDRGFGDCKIEMRVYEDLTDEQMADLFYVLNETKHVNKFQKFKAAVKAGYQRESAIIRTVEINHCKISQNGTDRCISAVGSLSRVFDIGGEKVLGQTIRTIRDAFDGDALAFDSRLIDGIGLVYHRYNGRIDEKWIVRQLQNTPSGCRGLLRRATGLVDRVGCRAAHGVAAATVDIYNKGITKANDKLPSWWKDAD